VKLAVAVLAVLTGWMTGSMTGCGYVGDPHPPSLDIPVTVTDLRAAEIGDSIAVEFTIPRLTTEGLPLKNLRAVEIAVGEGVDPFTTDGWAAQAKRYAVSSDAPGAVAQDIPARDWIGKNVVIGVRATGPKGKTSAWSNFATVSVIPAVAPPSGLQVLNVERGVALSWQGNAAKYRVFRAVGDGKPVPLGDTEQAAYLDESTSYGTLYQYLVQALASDTQQSIVAGPIAVTPVDVFAPAAPADVSAVAGAQAIELVWERNTESDFAGYNIYRAVDTGAFERIGAGVETPTFSDPRVESGKRYRYQVSAVDAKGNESARSAVVEVVAQ
jgi:fibronectin type 3 domain-containing protein